MRQRHREDLVGAERGIGPTIRSVDHVVEVPAFLVPEALVERGPRARGALLELLGVCRALDLAHPRRHQHERVVPERVDLHRLPATGGDHPVAALGVHPGQLVPLLALTEESVVGVDADVEPGPRDVLFDDRLEEGEDVPQELAVVSVNEVAVDGVEEPHGRVRRVIEAIVRALGEQVRDEAVAHVARERLQDEPRLVVPARAQAQALERDHGVAAPVREPVIPGDDRAQLVAAHACAHGVPRAADGSDHELVRGQHQVCQDRIARPVIDPAEQASPAAKIGRSELGGIERQDDLPALHRSEQRDGPAGPERDVEATTRPQRPARFVAARRLDGIAHGIPLGGLEDEGRVLAVDVHPQGRIRIAGDHLEAILAEGDGVCRGLAGHGRVVRTHVDHRAEVDCHVVARLD